MRLEHRHEDIMSINIITVVCKAALKQC